MNDNSELLKTLEMFVRMEALKLVTTNPSLKEKPQQSLIETVTISEKEIKVKLHTPYFKSNVKNKYKLGNGKYNYDKLVEELIVNKALERFATYASTKYPTITKEERGS